MKREIKFRAKVVKHDPMTNPDNGWVEGFYCQDLSNGEIKHYIHNCPMTWEVDSETIGQFTGLKDRNGIDIYEGDILRGALHNHVVKFKDGAFMADVEDKLGYDFIKPKLFKASLVIGNIYDNPEMLNTTND